jgi:hypothetical protein
MPMDPLANHGRSRAWVSAQQRRRAQDRTRRAEAALKRGAIEKRFAVRGESGPDAIRDSSARY